MRLIVSAVRSIPAVLLNNPFVILNLVQHDMFDDSVLSLAQSCISDKLYWSICSTQYLRERKSREIKINNF